MEYFVGPSAHSGGLPGAHQEKQRLRPVDAERQENSKNENPQDKLAPRFRLQPRSLLRHNFPGEDI